MSMATMPAETTSYKVNKSAKQHGRVRKLRCSQLSQQPKVVPTLVHDDLVIPDSTVIIEYLDQIAPENSTHPKVPWERAQARYWTKAVDEDLHPACGAMTFLCSHRHTVLRKLGKEGANKFLASTPEFSVTSDWKSFKDAIVRQGFEAPGALGKVKLYDPAGDAELARDLADFIIEIYDPKYEPVTPGARTSLY